MIPSIDLYRSAYSAQLASKTGGFENLYSFYMCVILAQTMASASGGSNGARSLICIWNVQNGTCRTTLFHHRGEVQSLAFSMDDRFFLSAGQ